ncbi:hypothetical protein PUV54_15335 [Hyphococcus flavus]|uniref:Uncharacterized protein n=1 Tax=Hyphococcus flavus TaxID=1866326 RepID=A0AAE9ZBT1_9PROT|nr:hypothetical protein [Hyphococcus flavus]WDI31321.1 hypothetical protein PUV54_15335 [Hyphococcus flavus]
MTLIAVAIKAISLIALTFVAFAALAVALGYEPEAAKNITACKAESKPVCIFTIF